MFDIKKYFGRRNNNEFSTQTDPQITKEASGWGWRPGNPTTTGFNRKLVLGLLGLFALVFAFSLFYGLGEPDKKSAEETAKDKKVTNVAQNSNHLDKLPSSYSEKKQIATTTNGENRLSQPPVSDTYTPPRQPYQSVNYNSPPPIPVRSPETSKIVAPGVNSTADKEEQELAEARKSPIRFTLK